MMWEGQTNKKIFPCPVCMLLPMDRSTLTSVMDFFKCCHCLVKTLPLLTGDYADVASASLHNKQVDRQCSEMWAHFMRLNGSSAQHNM